MKKKRFYNNKKRNEKWTEEPVGRKIDFADKYVEGDSYTDKYDSKRPNSFEKEKQRKRKQKTITRAIAVVLSLVLICTGYTVMDIYMTRHAVPAEIIGTNQQTEQGAMSELAFDIKAYQIDSVSLDSSVMLSSTIHEIDQLGYTSIVFDAKRVDGTIGYSSELASIDTYGAINSPASQPKKSTKELLANDILPIARISCYQDNVVPVKSNDMAIFKDESHLYTDKDGNYYLNPESDLTYNYLKDIISELHSYGINVFVLTGCNLPEDITEGYHDGFDTLAQKLNNDFDGNIKLIEEIDVVIKGIDAESGDVKDSAISSEIEALEALDKNKIYYITTSVDKEKVLNRLNKNDTFSYIVGK